jgi:hypothetical protein
VNFAVVLIGSDLGCAVLTIPSAAGAGARRTNPPSQHGVITLDPRWRGAAGFAEMTLRSSAHANKAITLAITDYGLTFHLPYVSKTNGGSSRIN